MKRSKIFLGLAAAASSVGASAASVLPADFATVIGDTTSDITTVGGALIGLAVVAMGIRWVKATFF